jgi:hypothetical protein
VLAAQQLIELLGRVQDIAELDHLSGEIPNLKARAIGAG